MHPLYTYARDARKLIELPSHWTVGAGARDIHGENVNSYDSRAVAFCSVGAMNRATGGRNFDPEANRALHRWLRRRTTGYSVAEWNDTSTHAEVVQAFDKMVATMALCTSVRPG